MINYIIQVMLFQTLFLAVYDLFLSKETFFTKNRWYLLGTAMVSFVLPFLKIPTIQKVVSQEYTILLPEIVLSPQNVIEQSAWYQSINYLDVLFWLGVSVFSVVFILKLFSVLKLIYTNEIHPKKNYKLVLLSKDSKAFSFFNYIFLGREIPKEKQDKIIQHELVHSQQKHTLDLLFFELLKIVMWFNPLVYIYQKRITLIHEFISDEVVTKNTEKSGYINNLLSEIFQVEHISFINQFYKHSLIKKRILMMTKSKSKQIKQLKYLLLVPVLASMLFYTSCSNEEAKIDKPVATKQKMTFYYSTEKKGMKEVPNGKESYFDAYHGSKEPSWKKITHNDLLPEEKNEYDEIMKRVKSLNSVYDEAIEIKLYQKEDGRKIIGNIVDFSKVKGLYLNSQKNEITTKYETEDVPFSILDKHPTFPGCAEDDKNCFNKSMREFVAENFNIGLAKQEGLSGKQRIIVMFRIDKQGRVGDIKSRAPHPKLKEEAVRLVKSLPQFKPGEKDGKKVGVKYTLPIMFKVE